MDNERTTYEIVHEPERDRFAVYVDELEAELDYNRLPDKVVVTHTGVPRELEGAGIGGQMAKAALDWARAEGLRVLPICPFVAAYIRRHPEYADLVKS